MHILVIQNHPGSPAGVVGQQIEARGGRLSVIEPLLAAIPAAHDAYDGVLVLGGAQTAADDAGNPYYADLFTLLRGFQEARKPMLGICLGAQLLARLFGGRVYRHDHVEFGFLPLWLTPDGLADPLLRGLPEAPHIMEFHEDTFDLPDEATLLMSGAGCRNQAYRIGDSVYAFQCHIEVTPEIVRGWARLPAALDANGGADPIARTEAEMALHIAPAMDFARTVTDRWVDLVLRQRRILTSGLRETG